MGEHPDKDLVFATVSMAEILLAQNLISETEEVVRQLQKSDPMNPRVIALAERLKQVKGPPVEQQPVTPVGADTTTLLAGSNVVVLKWELTQNGLDLAKRRARYSGRSIARLFTASPGPRGVRTMTRDIEIEHPAAQVALRGLPQPAVHVAAAGFLANTGMFVPLARSDALVMP